MSEVLNCPFCGGEGSLNTKETHATCMSCKFIPWFLVEEWNRRAAPADVGEDGQSAKPMTYDEFIAEGKRLGLKIDVDAIRRAAGDDGLLVGAIAKSKRILALVDEYSDKLLAMPTAQAASHARLNLRIALMTEFENHAIEIADLRAQLAARGQEPAACRTCGGSRVDPGGLPACRDCAAPKPALQAQRGWKIESKSDVWGDAVVVSAPNVGFATLRREAGDPHEAVLYQYFAQLATPQPAALPEQATELVRAADAVVERWHSKDWKLPHTAEYIARLAAAVGVAKFGTAPAQGDLQEGKP